MMVLIKITEIIPPQLRQSSCGDNPRPSNCVGHRPRSYGCHWIRGAGAGAGAGAGVGGDGGGRACSAAYKGSSRAALPSPESGTASPSTAAPPLPEAAAPPSHWNYSVEIRNRYCFASSTN